MTFSIGQRWISNTESQLGLGIITEVDGRQVCISFPAAEEDRIYATDNAPLSRISYKVGEEIITNEQQKLKVTAIKEQDGILFYTGEDESGKLFQVSELALNCFIKLNTPQQRLFSGLLDKLSTFKLRIETLNHVSRLQRSKARGLLGSRASHLIHQIYIAYEVAQRFTPRVLLADEVGLGKTIEAGMILHYQLHTGRASRVLIIVPNSLIHQWFVEMLRRFNLYFSIIDQNRYDNLANHSGESEYENLPIEENLGTDNLFESEQLVLTNLDFLMENEEIRQQILTVHWDLLVVDEAHHLHWSEESQSPEYTFIEKLSTQSGGLLLLTATPEQAGIESHFARLRLLDPARFYDFAAFKKEEKQYQEINQVVQELLDYKEKNETDELHSQSQLRLAQFLGEEVPSSINATIQALLDRYGTGRVLFRNTRVAIKGFPIRIVHPVPLTCPDIYSMVNKKLKSTNLYPESLLDNESWVNHDPRVSWLVDKIHELYPKKILVICAEAKTAITLEQYLKLKTGIRSAAFHEGLTIIERDRAAAYFAEDDNGAQVLVCSEIGSEGRNFQFSHHLALFDLPLNPDLLEQRIGRLDRIGQNHPIEIHVPYIIGTAQEKLFRWYHEGINIFQQSCSVGFSIFETFQDRLLPILSNPDPEKNLIEELIIDTKLHTEAIKKELSAGRDRLLELNSCNYIIGKELIDAIEAEENSLELENYMSLVYQEYGIDQEYHSENAEILRPGNHMKTTHFPGLKEDGMTVTYSRPKALIREDMEFLSWEHPMIHDSMEMILESDLGNATVTTISIKSIKPGTLFLETFYTINSAAPKYLQLDRFLPLSPIRILMDTTNKNLSNILNYEQLNGLCEPVKRHLGYPVIKQVRENIESILKQTHEVAEAQMRLLVEDAKSKMELTISQEINRLEALQKLNPAIRDEEIQFFKKQISESTHFINACTLKLQAIRVVINVNSR
ncbi:ATP-dependent helicase [Legionella norrlandica]|uniref:RNA polymerase-associated protein RapA n=1 Tax=Legionella norrlandica TaxID=1498499 RepID=A0A0A2SRT7_9GAMM|nr:RNA polymerase-associated protein RapA [Legionella norrlandica]KGP63452.1 ATP-dependent helicase [Legionella norrlandica]